MSLCIFGVCIPYTYLVPFLLLIFSKILSFFGSFFKVPNQLKEEEAEIYIKKIPIESITNSPNAPFNSGYQKITDSNKLKEFINSPTNLYPIYLKFTATWCPPCKRLTPYFIEYAEKYDSHGYFFDVDVDDHKVFASSYSISSIPVVLCLVQGKIVASTTGGDERRLKSMIESTIPNEKNNFHDHDKKK